MRSYHSPAKPAARHRATTRVIFPLVLLVFLLLAATTGYSFTALYAFGDSISDTARHRAPGELAIRLAVALDY